MRQIVFILAGVVYVRNPAWSMLRPILIIVYVSAIGRLISTFGVEFHQYADDAQLYLKTSTPFSSSLDGLSECFAALQN